MWEIEVMQGRQAARRASMWAQGLDQLLGCHLRTLGYRGEALTDFTSGVARISSPQLRAGALEFEHSPAPPLFHQRAGGRGQLLSPCPSVSLTLGLGWDTSEFP